MAPERVVDRGLLLTTEAVVVKKPEKEEAASAMPGGVMGDMY